LYSTYVGERVVLIGIGGKQPPYICFENNGGLGTMGKVSIVGTTMDASRCIRINIHGLSTSSTKLISELFAKRML
jgi:hypothetical protein